MDFDRILRKYVLQVKTVTSIPHRANNTQKAEEDKEG